MCLCGCIPHVYSAFSDQKRTSDSLSWCYRGRPLVWVLGRELRHSGKAFTILDCCAFSLVALAFLRDRKISETHCYTNITSLLPTNMFITTGICVFSNHEVNFFHRLCLIHELFLSFSYSAMAKQNQLMKVKYRVGIIS